MTKKNITIASIVILILVIVIGIGLSISSTNIGLAVLGHELDSEVALNHLATLDELELGDLELLLPSDLQADLTTSGRSLDLLNHSLDLDQLLDLEGSLLNDVDLDLAL